MPDRNPAEVEQRTGIATRRWVEPDETVAALGARCLGQALERAGLAATDLRRIVLANSTGGDYLIPATANALADELGLANSCDCFDLNNACMGFLSALDVASRCVATGLAPVAVVAVETLSRHIGPEQPRSYAVLGDASAAVILAPGRPGEGVLGSAFGNHGALRGTVFLAHPGLTGQTERILFSRSNAEITGIALSGLTRSAEAALDQAQLGWDDVDWVVPHQPNGSMLERIIAELNLDPAKVVPVVREIGSVGAASVGVGLDQLYRRREVKPGARILMVGVGAGLAYGAVLYQVAPHND